jgi:integral membrane protein (TIGR01906 family)
VKNTKEQIITIASIILIIIIVLVLSFFLTFINRKFYDKSFASYGTYVTLGVEGSRLIVDNLINYLTSENTEINEVKQLTLFTPKEQSHLADVQRLVVTLKYVGIAALVLLGIFIFLLMKIKRYEKKLSRILIISGIGVIAIIIILFLLSSNFPAFFETFHKILFPQGNYTFSGDSLLITLFPQQFFEGFARKMLTEAALIGVMLIVLGFAIKSFVGKKIKKENKTKKTKKTKR